MDTIRVVHIVSSPVWTPVTLSGLQEYEGAKVGPFLKWAGGKGQLLEAFGRLYPPSFNTYFEPFLGGGAVFFDLYRRGRVAKAYLSDANEDLINCYTKIRDNLEHLLAETEELQSKARDERFFYDSARPEFNTIKLGNSPKEDIRKAALLIYLNKTCFNGLYRVNSKGKFNVPWGRYKNPQLVNKSNLSGINQILNKEGIEVRHSEYGKIGPMVGRNDFVCFDPPYEPLNSTANFTSYTVGSFSTTDQKELADFFEELDGKGALLMLSNSPKVSGLYEGKGYRVRTVKAARAINSVGSKRGKTEEIIVTNY